MGKSQSNTMESKLENPPDPARAPSRDGWDPLFLMAMNPFRWVEAHDGISDLSDLSYIYIYIYTSHYYHPIWEIPPSFKGREMWKNPSVFPMFQRRPAGCRGRHGPPSLRPPSLQVEGLHLWNLRSHSWYRGWLGNPLQCGAP